MIVAPSPVNPDDLLDGALRYVVITPARNEAEFIEQTILSMTRQTLLPARWVIVSDGSTDGTDEIVKRYAAIHPWIQLLRMPHRRDRDFAGKVHAFNAGRTQAANLGYELIANLDADISFEPTYFDFLVRQFGRDPQLGVAGTPFREGTRQYDYRFTNIEHVSGACQVFRRECFDEIGGYKPAKAGGIDWVAVTTARMLGWRTRTFCEMVCHHHRSIGTAQRSRLAARFRQGAKDHALGGHPVWQLCRSVYQMRTPPVIGGGIALMAGYLWASLTKQDRTAGPELIRFHRAEQLRRLRSRLVGRRFSPHRQLTEHRT